jgi:hypothetical protein
MGLPFAIARSMASLSVCPTAMDIDVFQTVRKYGQSPITSNELKVTRKCPATSTETACLFNANILSIRALRHFERRKIKSETQVLAAIHY